VPARALADPRGSRRAIPQRNGWRKCARRVSVRIGSRSPNPAGNAGAGQVPTPNETSDLEKEARPADTAGMLIGGRTSHTHDVTPSLIPGSHGSSRGSQDKSWLTFRQAPHSAGTSARANPAPPSYYADRFVPNEEKRRAGRGPGGERSQAVLLLKALLRLQHTDQWRWVWPWTLLLSPRLPTTRPDRAQGRKPRLRATGITFRIAATARFYAPAEDYVQVPPRRPMVRADQTGTDRLHELGMRPGIPRV